MIDKRNPFTTPSDYFVNLSEQIIAHLPEKEIANTPVISLWDKVKPWAYMAAMFVGIALMIKVFVGTPSESNILTGKNNVSTEDIEIFYSFYENQYVDSEYREAMYCDDSEINN